ncbi:MAG: N-acetylglucosamine-6-phosphate deacetylase [Pirellulaceae bacterium]
MNHATESLVDDYVDLQVNGYHGIDFNDPTTSRERLLEAARAMLADGVSAALPTIITASLSTMTTCITNLRLLVEADPEAAGIFQGIHIEGPFLSPVPGYIGAHPPEHALESDPTALEQLLDAAGSLAKLVTLAPEVDVGGQLTKLCVERGVLVAAGHTDASLEQLEQCVSAGLRLFTHLGNGCPKLMDRHDNIIYRALRFHDRLTYSLIADGFHVPRLLFENLLEWLPRERMLVVSDAISAAGLGPGTYQLGHRQVQIGEDKAARDASGQHFVGAASTMRDADGWLRDMLGLDTATRRQLLVDNPARLLLSHHRPAT